MIGVHITAKSKGLLKVNANCKWKLFSIKGLSENRICNPPYKDRSLYTFRLFLSATCIYEANESE